MCGITGIIRFDEVFPDENAVHESVNRLKHRGPDNQSVISRKNVALGHARLSIIDRSSKANQPFSKDDGIYLTYNGEVYNYKELKSDLIQSGSTFTTDSDTEVLYELLKTHGSDGLKLVNGFYAFCYSDLNTGTSFIARDTMGIKPLVYFLEDKRFCFASDTKSLLAYTPEQSIDKVALGQYFRFNYIPAPRTILNSCKKVLPGEMIQIDHSNGNISSHISVPPNDHKGSLEERLSNAVRLRLRADIDVAAFLSGGIDSSIIASLAKDHKPDIQTFSVAFDNRVFDESEHAKKVAEHIGSDHHTLKVSEETITSDVESIVHFMPEPFADSSAIAVYALCKEVKQHVSIALSGDGADELFGGYNKHRALLRSITPSTGEKLLGAVGTMLPSGNRKTKTGNKLRQARKFAEGLKLSPLDRYLEWASFCSKETIESLIGEPYKEYAFRTGERANLPGFLRMDQELVLPNDMLTKVDSMSMAHALEVRTPFLDPSVVCYARDLPTERLASREKGKIELRECFSKRLPNSVFDQPKHGFEVPLQHWINNELQAKVRQTILESENTILNKETAERLLTRSTQSDAGDAPYQVWAMFVLQTWMNKYLNA